MYVWAECLPPPPGSQQPPCSDLVEYDFQLSIDQVRNDTGSVKQEGLVSNLLAVKNDALTQTGTTTTKLEKEECVFLSREAQGTQCHPSITTADQGSQWAVSRLGNGIK